MYGGFARIDPVSNVDIRMWKQPFHRPAQQGRMVTRHRRNKENLRLVCYGFIFGVADEMTKMTKIARLHHLIMHFDFFAINLCFSNAKLRLAIAARHPLHKLHTRQYFASIIGIRQRTHGVCMKMLGHMCRITHRRHTKTVHLVQWVQCDIFQKSLKRLIYVAVQYS